jgi:hypothetical protein
VPDGLFDRFRECNRRELVEELWRREAPHLADRLVVAE